jgi:hypothetical protein
LNIQDFIASGILESHLLGLTDEKEKEQVRQMMLADPSLEYYATELESDMREYFNRTSVPPPAGAREIVALRAFRDQKAKHEFNANQSPKNQYLDVEVNDTHIKVHKFWRLAFIAVFILSKIFLIAGLYFYFKSASQQEELNKLKTQTEQVK